MVSSCKDQRTHVHVIHIALNKLSLIYLPMLFDFWFTNIKIDIGETVFIRQFFIVAELTKLNSIRSASIRNVVIEKVS